ERVLRPTVSDLNDHRLKSPSRGKRRRTHCRGKEAQAVPAKKRPPAVKAILKQILMYRFYILLLTNEIDLTYIKYTDFHVNMRGKIGTLVLNRLKYKFISY